MTSDNPAGGEATLVAQEEAFRGIRLERRGGALWAILDRPQVLNALDAAMVAGLSAALDQAELDPDVHALVVTGTGTAFCAGADLGFIKDAGPALEVFLRSVGEAFAKIELAQVPVIAAVNGIAVAGGLELILCCDLVYAAETAQLGDGHANYGLLPGGGGSIRLPRRIGKSRANELLFTGGLVAAETLVGPGLINKVVPAGQLVGEVGQVVEQIAAKSKLGLGRMKRLVSDGLEQPVSTGLRLELLAGAAHASSYDMREGLAAFAGKRSPRFRGE
jgi:enoyl-CoA hydratase